MRDWQREESRHWWEEFSFSKLIWMYVGHLIRDLPKIFRYIITSTSELSKCPVAKVKNIFSLCLIIMSNIFIVISFLELGFCVTTFFWAIPWVLNTYLNISHHFVTGIPQLWFCSLTWICLKAIFPPPLDFNTICVILTQISKMKHKFLLWRSFFFLRSLTVTYHARYLMIIWNNYDTYSN